MKQFAKNWVASNTEDDSIPSVISALLTRDDYSMSESAIRWLKDNKNKAEAGELIYKMLSIEQSEVQLPAVKSWLELYPENAFSVPIVCRLVASYPDQSNLNLAMSWLNKSADPDKKAQLLEVLTRFHGTPATTAALKSWFRSPIHSLRSEQLAMHNEIILLQAVLSKKDLDAELFEIAQEWITRNRQDDYAVLIRRELGSRD
jgi:hypothetical protein